MKKQKKKWDLNPRLQSSTGVLPLNYSFHNTPCKFRAKKEEP